MKPIFLALDGPDGAGKTTAVNCLALILKQRGHTVKVVKGMGTGRLGVVVRHHLLSQYLDHKLVATACGLALLDCYKQVQEYMDSGFSVIADRSIATYYAYNVKANKDPGAEHVYRFLLNNRELVQVTPDLSIIIHADTSIAKQRMAARKDALTHIDERPEDYFREVAAGYYEYSINNKHVNPKHISNNGDFDEFKLKLTTALLDVIGH